MRLFPKRTAPSDGRIKRRIAQSGLFDPFWYTQKYVDVAQSGQRPIDHFMKHGRFEGRDPGPLFNAQLYQTLYGMRLAPFEDAFTHFLFFGRDHGLDGAIRTSAEHDVLTQETSSKTPPPIEDPHDPAYVYRAKLLQDSGLWDGAWYLRQHPDLVLAGVEPLSHFLRYGSHERRSPSERFDARWYYNEYLLTYSDIEPVFHYIEEGSSLGYKRLPGDPYVHWLERYNEMRAVDIDALASAVRDHVVSVFYVYKSDTLLESFRSSLDLQVGVSWDLVVVDSLEAEVAQPAVSSTGLSYVRGLDALQRRLTAAVGKHIVIAEADVVLRPHCLAFLSLAHKQDKCFIAYSNEDLRSRSGLTTPFFKPDYSPRLFAQFANISGCLSIQSPHYDCYSFTSLSDDPSVEVTTNMLVRLAKSSLPFKVESVLYSRDKASALAPPSAAPKLETLPSVCIIIPLKDKVSLLADCIDSIKAQTKYDGKFEILIVDNGSVETETLTYLAVARKVDGISVIRHDGPFNYSRINNIAAARSQAELLLFLNNDTVVIEQHWLTMIVAEFAADDVACVGAKLLYPDKTVQHGGIVLGIQSIAGHAFSNLTAVDHGPHHLNVVTREVSANTGACLAVRSSVFRALGGFDPALEVAFNDVAFCVKAIRSGYRNIWVHEALLLHYESKSRGYDITQEQKRKFLEEAVVFRQEHWKHEDTDAFYSKNLSVEIPYELAAPPRRGRLPTFLKDPSSAKRILLLSSTYQVGHGVAVVIEQHVKYLQDKGHHLVLGGSKRSGEISFPGASRVYLEDARSAAEYAVRYDIDCVIVHTPPFFSIVRYLGAYPAAILYDYGEPNPSLFPDRDARQDVNNEKQFCFAIARFNAAISDAVRDESGADHVTILPLANSHLGSWTEDAERRGEQTRVRRGWRDKFVVLNVCRFTKGERLYKGIGKYIDLYNSMLMQEKDVVFVLCGKGDPDDIAELSAVGLEVIANPTNEEIADIYAAADAYVNLSQWEGYNLGIAQALAMGLVVFASDIKAHRAFPIFCSNKHAALVEALRSAVHSRTEKKAIVYNWEDSLALLGTYLESCTATAIIESRWN